MKIKRTLSLLILVVLAVGLLTQCYAQEVKKVAMCLESERPVEVYLHCSPTARIYILKTQHGVQTPSTSGNFTGCSYKEDGQDPCASMLANIQQVEKHCMGHHDCYMSLMSVHLQRCNQRSDYFQVAYKCLTENSGDDSSKFTDICGDSTEGQIIARTHGYIESMNYPDVYPPDVMCTCKLKTARPDARIYLQLLDYDLQSDIRRNYDWLEYTTDLDMWGNDRAITLRDKTYELNTHTGEINLNFRTDGRYEGRGFWLEYEAKTDQGQEAEIQVQCQPFHPSYQKKKVACLHSPDDFGELYLMCGALGVINIIYAQAGNRNLSASGCDTYARWHDCANDVSRDPDILQCMGTNECYISVQSRVLPSCKTGSQNSNYLQVEYECIEAENKVTTDVCGDQLSYGSLEQQVGYIKSLGHPLEYSDNTRCSCRLETEDDDASIQITVLDISLELGHGVRSSCQGDWVEYVNSQQDWGSGHKLCNEHTGEPIYTYSKVVFLNFQTDDDDSVRQGRGFWVKYAGKTTDNTLAAVKVTCGQYMEEDDVVVVPTSTAGSTDGDGLGKDLEDADDDDDADSNERNLALIIGMAAIVALMLIAVIGLAVVKFTRSSAKAKRRNREESPETPLDTGFNSMKRTYSAFANRTTPYMPFRNNPSLTASLKSFTTQGTSSTEVAPSEPVPDYTEDVKYSRGGYHGSGQSYVNRSYEGSLDGGRGLGPVSDRIA